MLTTWIQLGVFLLVGEQFGSTLSLSGWQISGIFTMMLFLCCVLDFNIILVKGTHFLLLPFVVIIVYERISGAVFQ